MMIKDAMEMAMDSFSGMLEDLGEWASLHPEAATPMVKQAMLKVGVAVGPAGENMIEAELVGRLMAQGQFAKLMNKMADAASIKISPVRPARVPFNAASREAERDDSTLTTISQGSNRQAGTP
jgi:hypothetical protein